MGLEYIYQKNSAFEEKNKVWLPPKMQITKYPLYQSPPFTTPSIDDVHISEKSNKLSSVDISKRLRAVYDPVIL